MEKKGWLTGKKVAGVVFILFMIDASCFGAWWAITHPPEKIVLPEGVRIGLACDTTHYSGREIVRAAKMAVEEINEYGTGGPLNPGKGGVLVGKKRLPVVTIQEETQEMSPDVGTERTVAAATKLVTAYKVNVVMGGYATPMATLETCARYKIIYINTATSDDSITKTVTANYEKYKYVFNAVRNSTMIGLGITNFYAWLRDTYGFTKVAIISEEYAWADPIYSYFKTHIPEGMEIVYEVKFPSTTTTFLPYLTQAKNAGAELIMPIIALDWGITFMKEWAAMGYGLTAGRLVVADRTTFWEETGEAAKYHLHISTGSGIPPSNLTAESYHFYQGYKDRYGDYPMYIGEVTYAAVYAYAEAIERAGTLDSDAVVAELEETDMITPFNRFKWHKTNHSPYYGGEYWIPIFSQWMGPEYRPAVWSPLERFEYDEWVSDPIAYAALELPPWVTPPK